MPSQRNVDRPPGAVAVADQYRRLERPLSGGVALLVAAVVAVSILSLPLVSGVLAAAAVLIAVRVPLFTTRGMTRLAVDSTPDAVHADFESATPPVLAFQWGVADTVRPTGDGATYELSYLFGLRSVTMELETLSDVDDADLRLVLTADGHSWGTYDVTVIDDDGEIVVNVEWTADRRFGLNRLPQWLIAERYRADALVAQGYTPVERDATLSLSA